MRKILAQTAHRPWTMPTHPWLYYQEWNNLIFIHGRVDKDWLQQQVPPGIMVDTFNGDAWVSVVAFRMQRIRPRFLPPVKLMSDFGEINIRTYVTAGGKQGVYFLSMEGSKKFSVYLAKAISGLPYTHQSFTLTDHNLTGKLISFDYKQGEAITQKSAFDLWVTERYCLYYHYRNALNRYNIHHLPWPLSGVEITNLRLDYPLLNGMPTPFVPEVYHYSSGVRVAAWSAERVL